MLIRMGMGGQLSGSVGGVVASHNKGGAYLRNRTVPTNPNSLRQQSVRQVMSMAAMGWAALSSAQRSAWDGYANGTPVINRLGESITVSGWNMYVRTYGFFNSCGQASAMPAAAPAVPGLITLGSFTAAYSVATGLTVNGIDSVADGPFLVSIGPSLSPGVTFFRGPYTAFLTGDNFFDIDATPTVGNQSVNRYGVPIAGERRGFRFQAASGSAPIGRLATPYEVIITAAA